VIEARLPHPRIAEGLTALGLSDFDAAQTAWVLFNASTLKLDDLDALIAKAERAQGLGPILQPTAWRGPGAFEGHRAWLRVLRQLRALAAAVQALPKEVAP